MTRRPRKPEEHLVSAKLLGHAYGNMGELATCGGFFTYNVVMTCYGFPVDIYWELLSKQAYTPPGANGEPNYAYNEQPTFINGEYMDVPNLNLVTSSGKYPDYFHNMSCTDSVAKGYLKANTNFPYWLSTINAMVDGRVTFVKCCGDNYCSQFDWPSLPNYLTDISPVTGIPAAFTTEALFYAQSAYFTTIVMVQWSNVFSCKSRKVPFSLLR